MFSDRKSIVFVILTGIFITNAVTAELIGGKLIEIGPFFIGGMQLGPFIMSVGIIPWPVVFLTTDLMNEYYGKSGVRKLSMVTACLILYVVGILYLSLQINATPFSTVSDEQFYAVFGQSIFIILASIVAFLFAQFIDVFIFWLLRNKTGGKMIWLRATGSTMISQLIDTFVIMGLAFWLPGKMTTDQFLNASLSSYTFKLLVAIALTPLIYLGHSLIDKYLGKEEAHSIVKETAEKTLHHKVED